MCSSSRMPGRALQLEVALIKARKPMVKVNPRAVWDHLARLNMSQNDMARRIGISSGHLSRLISGSRNPSPRMRTRLQEALDCPEFDKLFIVVRTDG